MYPCVFDHYYSIHLLFYVLKLFYISAIFMKLLYRLHLHCYSLWYCYSKPSSYFRIIELCFNMFKRVQNFISSYSALIHKKIEFAAFFFFIECLYFHFSQPRTESHKFYTFLRLEKSDTLVFPFVTIRNIPTHL